MAEVPGTLEGWYALHDFRKIDLATLNSSTDRERIIASAAEFLGSVEKVAETGAGASGCFSIIGHKADLLLLHLRPTIDELAGLERQFNSSRLAQFTTQPYSYLSVTELSLYEASARGGTDDMEALVQSPFVQRRLKPGIPDKRYVCFYPMNKKRGEQMNWFTLDMEERRVMMREHGSTGRKYHDQVQQMITGSMGLDDWDWGVTLFADDPLAIKKLVYEMRFDEVSAKYAEFGPFLVGKKIKPEEFAKAIIDP